MLTSLDEQIIKAVYTFDRMNAEQVALVLGVKTVKYIRDRYLTNLCEKGYLHRFREPNTTLGVKPYIYTLGEKGIVYLRSQDFEYLPKKFVPQEEVYWQTLRHNLDLNNFLIAALLLTRIEDIHLLDFRHDSRLQHEPVITKETRVIPDGFLTFQVGRAKFPLWIELDTGSETNIDRFKEKIRNILTAFLSPSYEELFHVPGGTIAFATTRDGTRLDNMRKWTYQELSRLNHLSEADNFLFTKIPSFDPRTLFLSPIWVSCMDNTSIPLLDLQ